MGSPQCLETLPTKPIRRLSAVSPPPPRWEETGLSLLFPGGQTPPPRFHLSCFPTPTPQHIPA